MKKGCLKAFPSFDACTSWIFLGVTWASPSLSFCPSLNNLKMSLEALLRKRNERKVEKVNMLSEVKDHLLDLEKCSLHELMSILQKLQVIHL
jgi:hypothetical protein